MTPHPLRRTKIVATLGPATDSADQIRKLLECGVNLFRLNFSHGSHDQHREQVRRIRELALAEKRPVGILQDLQGPKIRTGTFRDPGGVQLAQNQSFSLTADAAPGDAARVGLTFPDLLLYVRSGQRLLLDDGQIELAVTEVEKTAIRTRVVRGGPLSNHKGINLPEADLPIPSMTDKDIEDLELGAALGVDWVALSFVRSGEDLRTLHRHLKRLGSQAKTMAKIERGSAVSRFDEILREADGIMIARGDLGVEMRPEQVPVVQKRIIRACIEAGKPVITATQMLNSMIDSPVPTRAEASDVANAIFDSTDAVMLSGETAVGRHPCESVKMMDQIIREVEGSPDYEGFLHRFPQKEMPTIQDAVCRAAARIAETLKARFIVSFTSSGSTAWQVARYRPRIPIVAITPRAEVASQLTMGWGIVALCSTETHSQGRMAESAERILLQEGKVAAGDVIVVTAGIPFGTSGTTNTLRVKTIGSPIENPPSS
jgi:pyruvate kinase